MSTQAFYDKFTHNWVVEHGYKNSNKVTYAVSSTVGSGWEYLPSTYFSEEKAREIAMQYSKLQDRGVPELWRVSRGNITIALYLNGEEIKEE